MNAMPELPTRSICFKSCSEEDTIELGRRIGRLLEPGDCVYLYGDMGTGKTRIAKGMINAATQTPVDEINSPTFVIINRYEGNRVIYHADLYRLENGDFEDIGIEMVDESQGILIVEWAEKMPGTMRQDALSIYLSHTNEENLRIVRLEWQTNSVWSAKLPEKLVPTDSYEYPDCEVFQQAHLFEGEAIWRS